MIRYIKGDLVKLANDNYFDVIIHGCNCFRTMGAGIAKQIKLTWPQVYDADLETNYGDRSKLGSFSFDSVKTKMGHDLIVINAYTQFLYGRTCKHVDYDAIRKVFYILKKVHLIKMDVRIGMPKIGCGLAGGSWDIVEKIIEGELENFDITIVEYSTKEF